MSHRGMHIGATMIAMALAGMAAAKTADTTNAVEATTTANTPLASPGQVRVADKFAAPFVTLAGSQENAFALATALRAGSPATLTYTMIAADGTTTTTTITITPLTKGMGWGNVSHSLALAQFALNQNGITNPTGAELQAALNGGTITTADGTKVALAGVLQQRADGMGFGRIAQSYGTTMGAVNRGIKAPVTTVATPTPVQPVRTVSSSSAPKVTTGQGVSSAHGLTTAAGTTAGTGHGAKGITTAAGATSSTKSSGIVSADGSTHGNGNAYGRGVVTASGSSPGVVSGHGNGNAYGRGVVTASGTSAGAVSGHGNGNAYGRGVVTASGNSAGVVSGPSGGAGVVTADAGQGVGLAKGHGNGKGKGGG